MVKTSRALSRQMATRDCRLAEFKQGPPPPTVATIAIRRSQRRRFDARATLPFMAISSKLRRRNVEFPAALCRWGELPLNNRQPNAVWQYLLIRPDVNSLR